MQIWTKIDKFAYYLNPIPMFIFSNQADLKAHLKSKSDSKSIGFVPTMGALHDGHLALIKKSLEENRTTVVSIFVNPTQFNNPEDLAKYPRTLDADADKLKKLNPKIIVYAPTVNDIYENDIEVAIFNFGGLEKQMEGKFRPGHFDGVGTVVKKLFEIVSPTKAYFGEKDFQQLQIVKKLVQITGLRVNIIECPIFREENGLAMSSRNERLSKTEREQAKIIYETLQKATTMFREKGTTLKKIESWVARQFENTDFKLDYFVIADEETLMPVFRKGKMKDYRAFIAVVINNIRLIDTISLN
jgi:pantoate--beta-alanine ligase